MKKLIAGNFWPMLTTEPGQVRLQRLQNDLVAPLDRLIECLILYDEVVLPTHDMIIIPALINVMGEENVRQLMDSGALYFLRVKRGFAFWPGKGAAVIDYTSPDGKKLPEGQDLTQLLEWVARDCTGTSNLDSFLSSLTSITSEVLADEFNDVIRDETEAGLKLRFRMDGAFFLEEILELLDMEQAEFAIKVPFWRYLNLQDRIAVRQRWTPVNKDVSCFETALEMKRWGQHLRVVVYRASSQNTSQTR